jgi:hypothetical protein
MRNFDTGATRNSNENKLAYSGFISPLALHAFSEYMHAHRKQKDGSLRAADNWKKGIPIESYKESIVRHVMDLWRSWEGGTVVDPDSGEPVTETELLCAIMFNVQGMLHEMSNPRRPF